MPLPGATFFAAVRPLFGGSLSQSQVDGINHIVSLWIVHGDSDDRKLAYILATAFHETAQTMQPVRETLAATDAKAKERLTKAWKAGRLPHVKRDYWTSGFMGRGYVQLTHAENYRKAGEKIGADLVGNPSLALDPDIAAVVLIRGMMEGWFTTAKLGDFIRGVEVDFVGARRVVNGTDRAKLIAEHAETFFAAVVEDRIARAGKPLQRADAPQATPQPSDPSLPRVEAPAGSGINGSGLAVLGTLIASVLAFILKLFGAY